MKRRRGAPVPIPPDRRRAFTLITIAFPLVFFFALEVSLRAFSYGPNLSLFTTEELAGKTYTVMNHEVKSRYFAGVTFNPSTSPDYFLVPKPGGTYRIFCLGASTTVGYPYWYNGSFSSFLRDRLRRIFPEKSIEVINMGMTATNSFTVNDMARELVDYEPDLFIVYDGHNEFYGALGVASNESLGGQRWLTRLYLRAIHLRTFLLLRDILISVQGFFSQDAVQQTGSTMMERLASGQYVPLDSPLYRKGLETYRANLQELVELCASRGIPLLLGSQVSNLRDLPPFVSAHPDDMSSQDAEEFARIFRDGMALWENGNVRESFASFELCLQLDPLHAEAEYMLGACLDSLGDKTGALHRYTRARDLDQLRFRMSTDFNTVMRELAQTAGVVFVDLERVFKQHSPDSLIGFNLMFEHVHPNSYGYFLMGKEYALAMREQSLLADRGEWAERDTISDEVHWSERCVTPMDELLARRRTEILTSGWPFVAQPPTVQGVAQDDTLALIVENMTRARWNWGQAHNAAADYHLCREEWGLAERELLAIINQLPLLEEMPYLKLAKLYLDQGRISDARKQLSASLAVRPTILAYRALGDIAMREGRPNDAVSLYRKTFLFHQTPPEQVENGYLLALALFRSDSLGSASQEALRVLRIKPDHGPTVRLLNQINTPR